MSSGASSSSSSPAQATVEPPPQAPQADQPQADQAQAEWYRYLMYQVYPRWSHTDGGMNFLVPAVLALVLEGSSTNLSTLPYYNKVAKHAMERDPALMSTIRELVAHITAKYRSARQYEFHADRVPVTKQTDRRVRAALQSDCAICLRPLRQGSLARLRAASGRADECGHFFHSHCIGEYELRNLHATKSCPVCRAELGPVVTKWLDHESHRPLF